MKKYRSINKKIFLITCILLILSLVTMYSVIVYLMPKTFFKYKDYIYGCCISMWLFYRYY